MVSFYEMIYLRSYYHIYGQSINIIILMIILYQRSLFLFFCDFEYDFMACLTAISDITSITSSLFPVLCTLKLNLYLEIFAFSSSFFPFLFYFAPLFLNRICSPECATVAIFPFTYSNEISIFYSST